MEKKELHPQIFLIENFLTEDQYISLSQEKVFEEAKNF